MAPSSKLCSGGFSISSSEAFSAQLYLITLDVHCSHSGLPLTAPAGWKMMGRDIAGPGSDSSRVKRKKVALIALPKKDLSCLLWLEAYEFPEGPIEPV